MTVTRRTTAQRLPPEIWGEIASYIPDDQFESLYSVNRELFELVMNKKYHSLLLNDFDSDQSRKLELHLQHISEQHIALRAKSLVICARLFYEFAARHAHDRPPPLGQQIRTFVKSTSRRALHRTPAPPTPLPPELQHTVQCINHALCRLINLHELWITGYGSMPYFSSAWSSLGTNLRHLTVEIAPAFVIEMLAEAQGLRCLEYLALIISHQDSADYATLRTPALFKAMATFVNRLNPTLRSLSLLTCTPIDFSQFFLRLGYFIRLERLLIHIPLDNTTLSDVSGLRRVLQSHSSVLKELAISHTCVAAPTRESTESWFLRIFDALQISGLPSLEIDYRSSPGFREPTPFVQARGFDTRFRSLLHVTRSYLQPYELGALATSMSLRRLCLNVTTLKKDLIDTLASRLPNLESLNITVEASSHKSSIVIVDRFVRELRQDGVQYQGWKLRDITISIVPPLSDKLTQYQFLAMEALAACVPTIESFCESGSLDIVMILGTTKSPRRVSSSRVR
ncbi:hypothetical protein HGRIS_002112 [Hohenbuehelia grisea]|uniref:F-box domain-containing protein n=1 Tax=Hohenbuehelia grisea TaxID=104357 RepID=A0ABR3JJK6_9AGAR